MKQKLYKLLILRIFCCRPKSLWIFSFSVVYPLLLLHGIHIQHSIFTRGNAVNYDRTRTNQQNTTIAQRFIPHSSNVNQKYTIEKFNIVSVVCTCIDRFPTSARSIVCQNNSDVNLYALKVGARLRVYARLPCCHSHERKGTNRFVSILLSRIIFIQIRSRQVPRQTKRRDCDKVSSQTISIIKAGYYAVRKYRSTARAKTLRDIYIRYNVYSRMNLLHTSAAAAIRSISRSASF